jgi:nitroreductase
MFLSLAKKRRSIRKYTDKPVAAEIMETLVEAMLRAPTAKNNKSWEFVVVTDSGLLEKLSRAKPHGSAHLKNSALAIVVCGNQQITDIWVEDASIAATYVQLAAASLKLGSCWIQIRERNHSDTQTAEAYIAQTLNLPAHIKVATIIAIGYPAESKSEHPKESLAYEKVSLNSYGAPYSNRP